MSNPIPRFVSAAVGSPDPDAALLVRFRDSRDQAAFAELVRRHGSLVWGVCRRALGDGPDAEDALQACFLVLANRLDTAAGVTNLSGWLYRVACLTAKKARSRRADRRAMERAVSELPDTPAPIEPDPELGRVIDEELARLPEAFRTAVVLCDLRQLTVDAAAVELGCPRGTAASRLSRGRALLGKRLLRRGLAAVGLAGVVAPRVPAVMIGNVVGGVFGDADGPAAQLSREVLRAMSGTTLKAWATGALVLAAVIAVGGLTHRGSGVHAAPVPGVKAEAEKAAVPAAAVPLLNNRKVLIALGCTPEQRVTLQDHIGDLQDGQRDLRGQLQGQLDAAMKANGGQPNAATEQLMQRVVTQLKQQEGADTESIRTTAQ